MDSPFILEKSAELLMRSSMHTKFLSRGLWYHSIKEIIVGGGILLSVQVTGPLVVLNGRMCVRLKACFILEWLGYGYLLFLSRLNFWKLCSGSIRSLVCE